jgi:opacity protein-like surface antigen
MIASWALTFGQEKRWNVEANYTVISEEGFGGNVNFGNGNFLDTGIKYRFIQLGNFDLGFGVNGGFWAADIENTGFEKRRDKQFLLQPRFFTELQIPGVNKLRPSLGLGFSFVNTRSDFTFLNGNEGSDSGWAQAFNFNLGLSYDITNRLFVQAQYDYIALILNNNLRIGFGFRF